MAQLLMHAKALVSVMCHVKLLTKLQMCTQWIHDNHDIEKIPQFTGGLPYHRKSSRVHGHGVGRVLTT